METTRIEITNELRENIVKGMRGLCYDADYDFCEDAFIYNLKNWAIRKNHLYNVFVKDKDFNVNELAIVKEVEIARDLKLSNAYDLFETWASNVNCPYRFRNTISRIFDCLENDGTLNFSRIYTLTNENYNNLMNRMTILNQKWGYGLVNFIEYLYMEHNSSLSCLFLLKYLKIQDGTKATKALNKIFDTFKTFKEGKYLLDYSWVKPVRELDPNGDWTGDMCKVLNFNQFQAQLNDMLSPKIDKKKLVISIHPLDYITQSNGNSWGSCHAFNPNWDNSYSGCNKGATLTMMVDPSSVIAYIIDNDNETDLWNIPKQNRQSLFINEKHNYIMQNVFYPEHSEYLSKIVRETIQNLFVVDTDSWVHSIRIDWDRVSLDTSEYKGYNDWNKGIDVSYLKSTKDDNVDLIIGCDAYCVDSEEFIEENERVCYGHYGKRWCEYCERWEDEDEFEYIDYYDRYFCQCELENAMYFCEDIQDYRFYNDCYFDDYQQCYYSEEINNCYVEDYGYVNEDDLNNSGDFFYCDECDCWYSCHYRYYHEHNGYIYCDSCYEDLDLDEEGDE